MHGIGAREDDQVTELKTGAVIVAAGRGERAGSGLPKQFRSIGGRAVLERTLERFVGHQDIGPIAVVLAEDGREHFTRLRHHDAPSVITCTGGASRTASVRAGLDALARFNVDRVLIHDAARPFVSDGLISRVVTALDTEDAALPALPVPDALFRETGTASMGDAVDRTGIHAAQTPQGFRFPALVAAYGQLGETSLPDDAAVARQAGLNVAIVRGEPENFKITHAADFERAEAQLETQMRSVTGQGFDVHRLEPADSMMLCGIEIRSGLGLVGHSDADVALHAVTDAVLGAAGEGDIGQHFPPSDPQWKGAPSADFLRHAVSLLTNKGGVLEHADLTVIGERPKIGLHRDAMRAKLAELLELPLQRVNIKATTTERLGFTGRGEGLAAQALVTARLPHAG